MGKYMRKAKVSSGEVFVMEVAAAPLGVRTRARALAMQKLVGQAAGKDQGEYLELRSRKLEKLPREPPARRRAAAAVPDAAEDDAEVQQVSLGENELELEAVEMNTRETTPCSLIRDTETGSTPGSTTRPSHSNSHHRVQAPVSHVIPNSAEMDAFFAASEQMEQKAFIAKYNFDPLSDCPLPGRYEWEKLD